MKTTIHFLRHGHVHNPNQILYGRLPRFRLSTEGKKQIYTQAQYFQERGIDAIYTSPLLRTRQTAAIVGNVCHIKPKIDRNLIEVKLIHDGIELADYKAKIQPFLYNEEYIKQGQESIEAITARMMAFVVRMEKYNRGKRILAVSHGDPIMILRAAIDHVPFTWEYKRADYLSPGQCITLLSDGHTMQWEKRS